MSEAHNLFYQVSDGPLLSFSLCARGLSEAPSGGRVGGGVGVAPPPGDALPLGASGAVPAVAAARASAQLPAASIGILAAAVAAAGAVVSDFFRIEPAGLDRFFSTAAVKPPPYFAAIRSSAAALPPVTDVLRKLLALAGAGGLVCCRGEEAGEDDCERSARARGENIARRRRMLRTFS